MAATAAASGAPVVEAEIVGASAASAAGAEAAGASAASSLAPLAAAAGPVAVAFGAVAATAGVAVVAIKGFAGMVKEQADKLAGYSADVALSVGRNEVRQEMAMLRRAQMIGPQVGRWETNRGRLEEKLTDVGTQILKTIMDWADRHEEDFEVIVSVLSGLIPIIEQHGGKVMGILENLAGPVAQAGLHAGDIKSVLQKMFGWFKDERKAGEKPDTWWGFDQIMPERLDWEKRHPDVAANLGRRRMNQDPHRGNIDPAALAQARAAAAGMAAGGP